MNFFEEDQYPSLSEEYWLDRGDTLRGIEFYLEAIMSYEEAIRINQDLFEAWHGRGNALCDVICYKEAIVSYEKVIELAGDQAAGWIGKGNALYYSNQYEEAIICFDNALQLSHNDCWQAWVGRSNALSALNRHREAISSLSDGIQALSPTNADYQYACGFLCRRKGAIQYEGGIQQLNPFPDWINARESYLSALTYLSVDKFPEEHLNLLKELLGTYTAFFGLLEVEQLLDDATAKLENLLQNSKLKTGRKITLKRKFSQFSALQVYSLVRRNKTQALDLAEKHKNRCLGRLHNGWKPPEPNFAKMQSLLNSQTAAIYWHLSPAALTTFILKHNCQPQIFELSTDNTEKSHEADQNDYYTLIAKQIKRLEGWIRQWKTTYLAHRELIGGKVDNPSQWQLNMQDMLLDEELNLRQILEIDRICEEYLQDVDQIVLIPHRDLHLLPLHALFSDRFTITYLPSAQIGIDLQHRDSLVGDRILCVEAPTVTSNAKTQKALDSLPFAKREVEGISCFYESTKNTLISGQSASKDTILASLNTVHDCFHFTGHGFHDMNEPLQSALAMSGNDRLTLENIFQLDLQNYSLICLSACETGITSSQDIIDEYIGLVSGFLSAGAAHVISTLWTVEDESSSLLMIQFHRYLRQALFPAQALSSAQKWLKKLTYQELGEWYKNLADELDIIEPGCSQSDNFKSLARDAHRKFKKGIVEPPYIHPYYWAGFIVTGKVPRG
jgi:CHAT domain-containing protein